MSIIKCYVHSCVGILQLSELYIYQHRKLNDDIFYMSRGTGKPGLLNLDPLLLKPDFLLFDTLLLWSCVV
jgi:hypothetical protein